MVKIVELDVLVTTPVRTPFDAPSGFVVWTLPVKPTNRVYFFSSRSPQTPADTVAWLQTDPENGPRYSEASV